MLAAARQLLTYWDLHASMTLRACLNYKASPTAPQMSHGNNISSAHCMARHACADLWHAHGMMQSAAMQRAHVYLAPSQVFCPSMQGSSSLTNPSALHRRELQPAPRTSCTRAASAVHLTAKAGGHMAREPTPFSLLPCMHADAASAARAEADGCTRMTHTASSLLHHICCSTWQLHSHDSHTPLSLLRTDAASAV